jgi:hypothetical protein
MAAKDAEYYKSAAFKARIQKMFMRDCIFGYVFVVWLWVTYGFVFYMTSTQSDYVTGPVKIILAIAGLMVCVYNTGSITAMVRHYSKDKDFIYTVDLRHYDAYRDSKNNTN